MGSTILQQKQLTNKRFFEELGDGIRLEMVLIRGGIFNMGSPKDEPEREVNEDPQHQVTVPTFFMGRYPITQAQWRAVAQLDRVNLDLNPEPSRFKEKVDSDRRPVDSVSWYGAQEFCVRLNRLVDNRRVQPTELKYQLPTEAQWEYACRGGTTTPFYWGETITSELANYDANYVYGAGSEGIYRQETIPVDHFNMANPLGLCDMSGNLDEWCLDHWHKNYEGAPIDGSAWTTDLEDGPRIKRGGHWRCLPVFCRTASRHCAPPDFDDYYHGFRVVLALRKTP